MIRIGSEKREESKNTEPKKKRPPSKSNPVKTTKTQTTKNRKENPFTDFNDFSIPIIKITTFYSFPYLTQSRNLVYKLLSFYLYLSFSLSLCCSYFFFSFLLTFVCLVWVGFLISLLFFFPFGFLISDWVFSFWLYWWYMYLYLGGLILFGCDRKKRTDSL